MSRYSKLATRWPDLPHVIDTKEDKGGEYEGRGEDQEEDVAQS